MKLQKLLFERMNFGSIFGEKKLKYLLYTEIGKRMSQQMRLRKRFPFFYFEIFVNFCVHNFLLIENCNR
tara:strand:+ start:53 stop:259 length:207 start_codon:yes stop_codon:yes gene_type:complete